MISAVHSDDAPQVLGRRSESRQAIHVRILAGSLAPTAGSHLYNRDLIQRLTGRGHRVSVIAFDADDELRRQAEIFTLPKPEADSLPVAWRMQTWIQAAALSRQLKRIPLETPDIVIASEHLFLKAHARRFAQTPWIYLPHSWTIGEEIDSYGLGGWLGRFTRAFYVRQQRWAATHADRIVRFNRAAATALSKTMPDSRRMAEVVVNPPGIEPPLFASSSERRTGPFRFLYVGRLTASKNVELILRSLSMVDGEPWTLDIVGDGPERGRLEEITRQLPRTGVVRFHGHQRDVSRFYAEADLLVFPSRLESQGLVILEAMSHGVPALVIREDGTRYRSPFSEVITDDVTGLLADDESDFAARLRSTPSARERTASIGRAARHDVKTRYCWERHLDRFESLFDELIIRRTVRN